jgi:hypothetical protein
MDGVLGVEVIDCILAGKGLWQGQRHNRLRVRTWETHELLKSSHKYVELC